MLFRSVRKLFSVQFRMLKEISTTRLAGGLLLGYNPIILASA